MTLLPGVPAFTAAKLLISSTATFGDLVYLANISCFKLRKFERNTFSNKCLLRKTIFRETVDISFSKEHILKQFSNRLGDFVSVDYSGEHEGNTKTIHSGIFAANGSFLHVVFISLIGLPHNHIEGTGSGAHSRLVFS